MNDINTIRKQLQHIKSEMPEIWQMITNSRCCPGMLGLPDVCAYTDDTCPHCWEKAIEFVNPVKIKDNKYYCPSCNHELILKITENTKQIWQCPHCKKEFTVTTMTTP